jgi:hypothetical protein
MNKRNESQPMTLMGKMGGVEVLMPGPSGKVRKILVEDEQVKV